MDFGYNVKFDKSYSNVAFMESVTQNCQCDGIKYVDIVFLWRNCGTLCGEQIRSWRWKSGAVSREDFLWVVHHVGHRILTQVSRFLQVKEDATFKTQTRCSDSTMNGHCEKSLVLWDEMAEPASETVKVIFFLFFFFLKNLVSSVKIQR